MQERLVLFRYDDNSLYLYPLEISGRYYEQRNRSLFLRGDPFRLRRYRYDKVARDHSKGKQSSGYNL